jgi:DHA2 family multidrug resistance protein
MWLQWASCFFAFRSGTRTRAQPGYELRQCQLAARDQLAPIPFCFISITTAAYVGIPKEQSNQVAGLINFVRNIGGSIFIAVTGAAVTNRDLWHEARLQESMTSLNIPFQQYTQGLNAASLGQNFGKAPTAGDGDGQHLQPAQSAGGMLGYQDVYKMLFWMALGMVFLSFMLNKNRPGEGGGGGGAMH